MFDFNGFVQFFDVTKENGLWSPDKKKKKMFDFH